DPHDLPLAQHRDAVGELLGLVEVVRGEQDGLAERAERADHLPRRAAGLRVEAGGGLVEEDEVGIADERDAEVEPPLLAARQRLDARVRLVDEPDERDHLVDEANADRKSTCLNSSHRTISYAVFCLKKKKT